MKTSFPETTLTTLPPDHGKIVLHFHRLFFNICDLTGVVCSLYLSLQELKHQGIERRRDCGVYRCFVPTRKRCRSY